MICFYERRISRLIQMDKFSNQFSKVSLNDLGLTNIFFFFFWGGGGGGGEVLILPK